MTDFNKILDKAKEIEAKMKESQANIKKIRVEGISGSNSIKIVLDGEGEMQNIEISDEILKEDKSIIEDLIVAAHNNAKAQLKLKTTEEISIKDKEKNIQKELIENAKKSDLYKTVQKYFPDAELININSFKKKEDNE